jgi:site-specific recombinase XerD
MEFVLFDEVCMFCVQNEKGERKHTMTHIHSTHSRSKRVTAARALAQRAKLTRGEEDQALAPSTPASARTPAARARVPAMTIDLAIQLFLQDLTGGNRSQKTIEWHQNALSLLHQYLVTECQLLQVTQVTAAHLSAWLTWLRQTPGARGKPRTARTLETYAWSARAFCNWLVRRDYLARTPFEQVAFPKVGKPLIRLIEPEEFERLLLACRPPAEIGALVDRAAARNRAILWVFLDTGIRVSELCGLRLGDFDRRHGILTVWGKGSKERRIALGQNGLRNLLYYLDRHRPDEIELAEWGSAGEDHLFLSETRLPLTKNGVGLLFSRLKTRAGILGKRVSPHILRHTFAVQYLQAGGDPFSLQDLLGHEDISTVKLYMHMNDTMIQDQKRKYSPGDHLPKRMPGPHESRRRRTGRA